MTIREAQWFDALNHCRCGRPANGVLRGTRNESYGSWCKKCAEHEIKKAQQLREKEKL